MASLCCIDVIFLHLPIICWAPLVTHKGGGALPLNFLVCELLIEMCPYKKESLLQELATILKRLSPQSANKVDYGISCSVTL